MELSLLGRVEYRGCWSIDFTPHCFLDVGSEEESTEDVDKEVAAVCHVGTRNIAVSDALDEGEWREGKLSDHCSLKLRADEVDEEKHEHTNDDVGFHVLGGELAIETLQLLLDGVELLLMRFILCLDDVHIAFLLHLLVELFNLTCVLGWAYSSESCSLLCDRRAASSPARTAPLNIVQRASP